MSCATLFRLCPIVSLSFFIWIINNEMRFVMQKLTLYIVVLLNTWIESVKLILLVRCHLNKWYRNSAIRQNKCEFLCCFSFSFFLFMSSKVKMVISSPKCSLFVIRYSYSLSFGSNVISRNIEYEKLLSFMFIIQWKWISKGPRGKW